MDSVGVKNLAIPTELTTGSAQVKGTRASPDPVVSPAAAQGLRSSLVTSGNRRSKPP